MDSGNDAVPADQESHQEYILDENSKAVASFVENNSDNNKDDDLYNEVTTMIMMMMK